MDNLPNCALYFQSGINFPSHFNISDQRLRPLNNDTTAETVVFYFILAGSVLLFYSNQRSYFWRIGQWVDRKSNVLAERSALIVNEGRRKAKPTRCTKFNLFIDALSALYKAITASLSLAAFLKEYLEKPLWILCSFCLCGNFLSQLAIFLEPTVQHLQRNWHQRTVYWVSHLMTLLYNLPNTALYFNTGNRFLWDLEIIDHRLTNGTERWEKFCICFLYLNSVMLFLSTQRSYSSKTMDIFRQPQSKKNPSQYWHQCTAWLQEKGVTNAEAIYSGSYKAAINYLSIAAALYSFEVGLPVSLGVGAICLPGILLGNITVFKPQPSPEKEANLNNGSTTAEHAF